MARKPLITNELDIAKNICYNIVKKGSINNNTILWRIKLVNDVEKQKMKSCSTLTQQQKMEAVSVRFVETKMNETVGIKIQKLIESICGNGETKMLTKKEQEAQNITEQTKKEYHNIIKNINENEKKIPLENMVENVSAVEKQDLNFSPLTTLEVEEEGTEKKLKTETSTPSLKNQDTQKTDLDYSAQTVISQWVCMDIVHTIKISFEGKEYDFDQLSDGSFIWNENLEPYRKQAKLNVAENVLKWGTGGINIDESRVGIDPIADASQLRTMNRSAKEDENGWGMNQNGSDKPQVVSLQGRFPANLILTWKENEYIIKEDITNEQKEKVCTWLQKNL